jgi:hypothetical protein
MIYRELGFFAVAWFDSSPTHPLPLSRQQGVSLSQSSCVSPVASLLTGEGGGSGGGVKAYNGEKAWSFYNHSILSEYRESWLHF